VIKNFEFKLKTNKKVKIRPINILSQMTIYKFLPFKFDKNVRFFIKIRDIKRETCFAGKKCYLFALEQIEPFYTQDHKIVSKNAG